MNSKYITMKETLKLESYQLINSWTIDCALSFNVFQASHKNNIRELG